MTYHPKSDFMSVMMERGFLADCTDYQGLDDALSRGVVTTYMAMTRPRNRCMWGIC